MKSLVKVLLIGFYLQACNSSADENLLSGHYIYGNEVNSFYPCGKNKDYWVIGSDKTLQDLESRYYKLTKKPYEEVFVKVQGEFIGKATDGFAMDYDGQVRVSKIHLVRQKADNDCVLN